MRAEIVNGKVIVTAGWRDNDDECKRTSCVKREVAERKPVSLPENHQMMSVARFSHRWARGDRRFVSASFTLR